MVLILVRFWSCTRRSLRRHARSYRWEGMVAWDTESMDFARSLSNNHCLVNTSGLTTLSSSSNFSMALVAPSPNRTVHAISVIVVAYSTLGDHGEIFTSRRSLGPDILADSLLDDGRNVPLAPSHCGSRGPFALMTSSRSRSTASNFRHSR
jgi:hypothetical protein